MSSFNSLAQKNVICLNEKGVSIPVFDFYHKNKTSIYNHVSIETDSVIFKRLRYNYYFGDLRKDIKSQFFKLLYQKHGIDTTKALVIHYRDTIKAMKNFPKRDSVVHEGETEKWHWHLLSYKGFKRNHFKCLKRYKKFKDANILHFYGVHLGSSKELEEMKWLKDYGMLISKLFSDGYSNFKRIIIHPNGEFYITDYNTKISIKDLIENKYSFSYNSMFLLY